MTERVEEIRMDNDIKSLIKAVQWIERSTNETMKRAATEFIYDRYIRNPSIGRKMQWHREGPHGGPPRD